MNIENSPTMNQNQGGGVQSPTNQPDIKLNFMDQNITNYNNDQYINLNDMNTKKFIDNMPYVFCPKCGNKVIADSNFCGNCGYRINR